jgi:hypothetical protein
MSCVSRLQQRNNGENAHFVTDRRYQRATASSDAMPRGSIHGQA